MLKNYVQTLNSKTSSSSSESPPILPRRGAYDTMPIVALPSRDEPVCLIATSSSYTIEPAERGWVNKGSVSKTGRFLSISSECHSFTENELPVRALCSTPKLLQVPLPLTLSSSSSNMPSSTVVLDQGRKTEQSKKKILPPTLLDPPLVSRNLSFSSESSAETLNQNSLMPNTPISNEKEGEKENDKGFPRVIKPIPFSSREKKERKKKVEVINIRYYSERLPDNLISDIENEIVLKQIRSRLSDYRINFPEFKIEITLLDKCYNNNNNICSFASDYNVYLQCSEAQKYWDLFHQCLLNTERHVSQRTWYVWIIDQQTKEILSINNFEPDVEFVGITKTSMQTHKLRKKIGHGPKIDVSSSIVLKNSPQESKSVSSPSFLSSSENTVVHSKRSSKKKSANPRFHHRHQGDSHRRGSKSDSSILIQPRQLRQYCTDTIPAEPCVTPFDSEKVNTSVSFYSHTPSMVPKIPYSSPGRLEQHKAEDQFRSDFEPISASRKKPNNKTSSTLRFKLPSSSPIQPRHRPQQQQQSRTKTIYHNKDSPEEKCSIS